MTTHLIELPSDILRPIVDLWIDTNSAIRLGQNLFQTTLFTGNEDEYNTTTILDNLLPICLISYLQDMNQESYYERTKRQLKCQQRRRIQDQGHPR